MAAPIGSHLAWYADADFVAARNHVIPPNGQTAYGMLLNLTYLKEKQQLMYPRRGTTFVVLRPTRSN